MWLVQAMTVEEGSNYIARCQCKRLAKNDIQENEALKCKTLDVFANKHYWLN